MPGKVKAYELQSKYDSVTDMGYVSNILFPSFLSCYCAFHVSIGQRMTWPNNLRSWRVNCWLCACRRLRVDLRPSWQRCTSFSFRYSYYHTHRFIRTHYLEKWSYSNTVRKSIARVLTVTNQKQRQNLKEFYKNKKYLPLDLRPKRTRAIRRRLTPVSILAELRIWAPSNFLHLHSSRNR